MPNQADRLIRVGSNGGLYRRVVQLNLAALELRYNAAEHEPLEVVAVERGIGAAEHRAPAVAEHEVQQSGVVLNGNVVQRLLILEVGHVAAGVRVAHCAAVVGGLAVADVVVRVDDEARGLEFAYHVQIAAGVLAEAVDELNDGSGLAERGLCPCLDGVAPVGGWEADLSYGHAGSSL